MAYKRDLSQPLAVSPRFDDDDKKKKKKKNSSKAKLSDLTPSQQKKINYMKEHSKMSNAARQNAINLFHKSNQKKN